MNTHVIFLYVCKVYIKADDNHKYVGIGKIHFESTTVYDILILEFRMADCVSYAYALLNLNLWGQIVGAESWVWLGNSRR